MTLSDFLTPQMLGGLFRSLLIAAGAGSFMSADQIASGAGALAVIVGIAWSLVQKKVAADKKHEAVVNAVYDVAVRNKDPDAVIAASKAGNL